MQLKLSETKSIKKCPINCKSAPILQKEKRMTVKEKMNWLNLAHNLEKVVIFVLLFAGKISDIFRASCQSNFMYDFFRRRCSLNRFTGLR